MVRINNAGPYWGNRKLDVSIATAKRLGFAHAGVAKLHTMVLYAPTKGEARYSRHRNYKKVLGYLGKFDSLQRAHRSSIAISAIEAIAGSTTAPVTGAIVAASRFETRQLQKQRARVSKKAKAIKLAMHTSHSRWPDFAVPVKMPETFIKPVLDGKIVLAKDLVMPPSDELGATLAQLSLTPTQKLILSPRPGSPRASSIARGEWAALAKPAITLVYAMDDEGVSDEQEWLSRGRLGYTFQVSSIRHSHRVSSLDGATRPPEVAINQTYPHRHPIPDHSIPQEHKVARAVG